MRPNTSLQSRVSREYHLRNDTWHDKLEDLQTEIFNLQTKNAALQEYIDNQRPLTVTYETPQQEAQSASVLSERKLESAVITEKEPIILP